LASKAKKKAGAAKKAAKGKRPAKKRAGKKVAPKRSAAKKPAAKKRMEKKVAADTPASGKPAPAPKMEGAEAPSPKKRAAPWRTVPEPKEAGKAAPARPEAEGEGGFEPRIVAFACNWCSYPAADAAGINKMQYPPNARVIRVMCAGRIHPAFVLRALELGADGVLVSGCHFEDCHYLFGARRAAEAFEKTAELVRILGLEPERVRYEQISAAEAPKFARVMHEFVDDIKKVGPSPLAGLARGKLTVPDAVTDETT
jgi:F420-non-reducing hydrogenase iron-sulfur subunit